MDLRRPPIFHSGKDSRLLGHHNSQQHQIPGLSRSGGVLCKANYSFKSLSPTFLLIPRPLWPECGPSITFQGYCIQWRHGGGSHYCNPGSVSLWLLMILIIGAFGPFRAFWVPEKCRISSLFYPYEDWSLCETDAELLRPPPPPSDVSIGLLSCNNLISQRCTSAGLWRHLMSVVLFSSVSNFMTSPLFYSVLCKLVMRMEGLGVGAESSCVPNHSVKGWNYKCMRMKIITRLKVKQMIFHHPAVLIDNCCIPLRVRRDVKGGFNEGCRSDSTLLDPVTAIGCISSFPL